MRELFRRRCYLNGITDPAAVDRLFREDQDRRKANKKAHEAAAKRARRGGPPKPQHPE